MPSRAARVLSACGVALALASCGHPGGRLTAPSPSGSAVPSPPLVTPPEASSVTSLDVGDVLALANAHRIRTAVVSATAITGTMVSDIAPQQLYSAPKPPSGPALTSLLKALREGGAVVTMSSGRA